MAKRKIIEINRDLCDGCGLCTTACAEGALALDRENKAVLLKEIFCDGMGACLDVCPAGALQIIDKESKDYDARAAYAHVLKERGKEAARHVHGIGEPAGEGHLKSAARQVSVLSACPGSVAREIPAYKPSEGPKTGISPSSELRQWPIQLHLISPHAPYFNGSDLLVAADCTAFSLGSFHSDLLKGKRLVIACPKLDETDGYVQKLSELIKHNSLRSLTVVTMTVPCCSGLLRMVERAVDLSGVEMSIKNRIIGIDGKSVC